ncbi:MAG: hypothetical protein R2876_07580 [Eubacteriales bacterium]
MNDGDICSNIISVRSFFINYGDRMNKFPDLTRWFNVTTYCDFNDCRKIEINMKSGLTYQDINSFCNEFAKYLCRIRCPQSAHLNIMIKSIDSGCDIETEEKAFWRNIFFRGFISQEKFNGYGDYTKSFDDDAILGYIGEALYYVVRAQILEDEKVCIEPSRPKFYSKDTGIDFLEIRKETSGYYMIIGEIKATKNTISSRAKEIIESFKLRADKNFSELCVALQDRHIPVDNLELSEFISNMCDLFYHIGQKPSLQKRYGGIINYNFRGQKIRDSAFHDFKEQLTGKVADENCCRRLALVGIYNIENIIDQVRDTIWNKIVT